MKNFRSLLYVIAVIVFFSPLVGAQVSLSKDEKKTPVSIYNDSVNLPFRSDSLRQIPARTDILRADSLLKDTVKTKKDALDGPVDYVASDSIVFTSGNWGYLYGKAKVEYQNLTLEAENITINMDSSLVYATYGLDSIGAEFGYPVFSEGSGSYESKEMKYNFKTRKGYSKHTVTEQGEGYVVAQETKMNPDKSVFMCNGRYTTCDNHDHPHFYLMLTKAKVRPGKDIITGPAYLVIEDIPLPFALPFGFFPFSDKYSSGVIMPTYGDEMERGWGLRDGGYYFAINDYVDLAARGEIWTKGSWGVSGRSTYRKRYQFSGNADISYLYTKYGDKGDTDYSTAKDFRVSWSHSQDPKANMYRTLAANVNYSSQTYNRNNLTDLYNGYNTNNTKTSSVTITQRFPNSPFTVAGNFSAAQVTSDTTVSLTIPDLTVTMGRIFPFKKKDKVGAEKWYEKVQLSYIGNFRNSITAKEDKVFRANMLTDWNNGAQHKIPVSATFSLFNYLNITPSFNYTERWYTKKITKEVVYNGARASFQNADTISRFKRLFDFNYAISFQTKLYGFYEPLFKIGGLDKIRHVFTPSISFSGQPDFSDSSWGYYESLPYYDEAGNIQEYKYSPYSQNIFGAPSAGKQGNINFSFDNNLEMKWKTQNDSTKIISLIDNLGIGFSYNMMADSLRWSDIRTNTRLKLSKNLTVNINAVFDPYMYNVNQFGNPTKIDKLRIAHGKGFGRLRSTGYSISPSINQDTFKKWFGKGDDKAKDKNKGDIEDEYALDDTDDIDSDGEASGGTRKSLLTKSAGDDGDYDENGYLRNEVKWNLSLNYSFNYGYNTASFDTRTMEYRYKLTHNLGLSGSIQPTKNWNFSFSTSYDFDSKKFAQVNCNLTRNLHCWSLTASFIPIGYYKSYFVSLRANSSMLQDLKYDKRGRSSSFDPEWY